jgi:hypothetical protein
MPAAEVDVSVELVRQLLAEQHPDLAGLALGVLANGWGIKHVPCDSGGYPWPRTGISRRARPGLTSRH